jgi:dihydrodipicolinate synthase/N-acetylneuraminate lyase
VARMIRGALAAAVTPLRDDGERLDEDAVGAYVDFLAAGGMDGIFALGTTGEGILLRTDERRRAAERFVEAAQGRLAVVVHAGAQTTAETVALCEHATAVGADGVAVVAPPYYAFDEAGLLAHFAAAARACAPTPFYLYEFAARSGYAIPLAVVERLREEAANLAGLKVSDAPFDQVEPYLLEGLDVFVGVEALVPQGLAAGAAGTVSGLASVFPEPVAALIRDPGDETSAAVATLRGALERPPFVAAAKRALGRRGVPVREDVRAPLRVLTGEERNGVDRAVGEWLEDPRASRYELAPGPRPNLT